MQYCLIRYKKINISLNFQNNPCYSSSQVISTLLNKLNFWLVWPMCLSLDLRDPNVFHLIWPWDLWPVWPLCLSFETFDLCNPCFSPVEPPSPWWSSPAPVCGPVSVRPVSPAPRCSPVAVSSAPRSPWFYAIGHPHCPFCGPPTFSASLTLLLIIPFAVRKNCSKNVQVYSVNMCILMCK